MHLKVDEQAVSKRSGNSGGLKIYLATYRVRYAEFTYVTICTDCIYSSNRNEDFSTERTGDYTVESCKDIIVFCVFRLFVFACRFKQLKQHPTRLRC